MAKQSQPKSFLSLCVGSIGKPMIYFVYFLIFIVICFIAISIISHMQPSLGLVNDRLRGGGNKPNWVCSENVDRSDTGHYLDPITFNQESKETWDKIKHIVTLSGGSIVKEEENYLHATYTSKLFRFVDDLELRLDETNKVIHMRSSSRVGYSDLGVNRKRAESIISEFKLVKNND